MLELCLILCSAAHLLAVNIATGGPFVCVGLQWRESRRGDALAGQVGRWLLKLSLASLAVGILLGALVLGLVWLLFGQGYLDALAQLPLRRYWFGLAELGFSLICLGLYLQLWNRSQGGQRPRRLTAAWVLGLLAGTNLLYHFPVMFAVIGVFFTRPDWQLEGEVYASVMLDGEVLSRFLHFALASVAVTGTALLYYALRYCSQTDAGDGRRVAEWGGRLALAPTLLQWLAGLYVLLQLPEASRDAMLGHDLPTTCLFTAALLAAVAMMHKLAALALGETARKEILGVVVLMFTVVVLMVGARHQSRQQGRAMRDQSRQMRVEAFRGQSWPQPSTRNRQVHIPRAPRLWNPLS